MLGNGRIGLKGLEVGSKGIKKGTVSRRSLL
ncbi:MAG: hypothetical protein ACI97A_003924, partial [Planctomycetota bacterium]